MPERSHSFTAGVRLRKGEAVTHTQAEAILFTVCAEFGVTLGEVRHGSRTPSGASVTLARATFMHRAWKAGTRAVQAASLLNVRPRAAMRWFADFRARAGESPCEREMRRTA